MKLFKLFGQNPPQYDPYWEFQAEKHFRPSVDTGKFYSLSGFDFGWFILEPISAFVGDKDMELEKGRCLSHAQKALYYWWHLDAQVTNGGWVQFYYNGFGDYVPTIIKSLHHIGDTQMAALVQRADNIYQKNKKIVDKARQNDLFGSDLYKRLDKLVPLDQTYYTLNKQTISVIEKYIRQHPDEFCLDENGNGFDLLYSGECRTLHPDHSVKDIFTLKNGRINGSFRSYYTNGNLKEIIQFCEGELTGERQTFFENGNPDYIIRKNSTANRFEHIWHYENGHPKKSEYKLSDKDERTGEYKEWYENGQISEISTYTSNHQRTGKWLKFYPDGSRKLEALFKDGAFLVENCWNQYGEQTLKDGTGTYIYEYTIITGGSISRHVTEYINYKRNGKDCSYTNGLLTLCQEMENNKSHGYTRTYYKNGKVKSETLYRHGEVVSSVNFPISDNPTGRAHFQYMNPQEDWMTKKGLLIPDIYPVCINEDTIKDIIKTPPAIFEIQYQDTEAATGLWLFVDEEGNVTDTEFWTASMTNGKEFLEVAHAMKFNPATKDGSGIGSCIYIIARFNVE